MSLYDFATKKVSSNHPAPLKDGGTGLYCSVCGEPNETIEELEQVTLASVDKTYIGHHMSGEPIEFHYWCIGSFEGNDRDGYTLIPVEENQRVRPTIIRGTEEHTASLTEEDKEIFGVIVAQAQELMDAHNVNDDGTCDEAEG